MKKVLVLAAACFTLLLCGCSENEIGMTGMIYDSHSIEQYAANGTYRANNSNLSESGEFVPSMDSDYFDTEFEKHVNMSDPGDSYYHYILRGTEYGTELKAPMEIYGSGRKKYLSLDTMAYINDMKFTSEDGPAGALDPIYAALRERLGNDCFVEVGDDFSGESAIFGYTDEVRNIFADYAPLGINSNKGIRPFADAAQRDYLYDSLSGFDSGIVEKTENGYSVTVDSRTSRTVTDRLDKYMADNAEHAYSAYAKYAESLGLDFELSSEFDFMAKNLRKLSRDEFIEHIRETGAREKVEPLDSKNSETLTTAFIDGTYTNTYETVRDYSYIQKSDSREMYEHSFLKNSYDAPYATESFTENITPAAVEKTLPENVISYEEYKALYNELDPVAAIEFEQKGYSESGDNIDAQIPGANFTTTRFAMAFASEKRASGMSYPISYSDFGMESGPGIRMLSDENGSIYVPLRVTAERLGENVVWDENTGCAFIERNGEFIKTDGTLFKANPFSEEIWYTKARDLEKLGYNVAYSETHYSADSDRKDYKLTISK